MPPCKAAAVERSGSGKLISTKSSDGDSPGPRHDGHARGGGHGGDRLLGECSLNLVEVVSGRAPHMEEWVPLDSEGDLRLSLDYDSVGTVPVPGDSVSRMCCIFFIFCHLFILCYFVILLCFLACYVLFYLVELETLVYVYLVMSCGGRLKTNFMKSTMTVSSYSCRRFRFLFLFVFFFVTFVIYSVDFTCTREKLECVVAAYLIIGSFFV